MLSYVMFKLEEFYKESFLSMQPKDLCINCEKINFIRTAHLQELLFKHQFDQKIKKNSF